MKNKNEIVLIKSLVVNTFLVLIKLLGGIFGKSAVLVADGIHSFSDLTTDIVAIISCKMSRKPADKDHPFGHGRIEYLCCLGMSIFIFCLGISIIFNAFTNEQRISENIVLYIVIVTVIIKFILSSYILKKGKELKNNLLIASGKESRSDVYSSLIVVVALIGSKLARYNNIFSYSELIGTIVLGVVIIVMGLKIFAQNITTIIGQKETDPNIIKNIKDIIKSDKSVKSISNLVLLKYGTYYKCDLTILLKSNMHVSKANKIIEDIKEKLLGEKTNIKYINISIEPY